MVSREEVLEKHRHKHGKIEVIGNVEIETKEQLSVYYTPGVAQVCLAIKDNRESVYDYTLKGRTVAIVTDGTRILGLGKIGPEAGLPVMEGKALLLKKFGGVDAVPICLSTTDEEKIIEIVKSLQPSFGAINIEDIESPKCFRIVDRLKKELEIPVFHDDRSGVGAVTLAALSNALKLAGKKLKDAKIVINGAGAGGTGIVEALAYAGARNIYVFDTSGILYKGRAENMNYMKEKMAELTNQRMEKGSLRSVVKGADVLIGISTKGAFDRDMIKSMADKPIVFALANPEPEIGYDEALEAGAFIVATGRSDKPNQVNNLSAFPGILRGILEARAKAVDDHMITMAARAIAKSVGKGLSREMIMPSLQDSKTIAKLASTVAAEIVEAAKESGLANSAVDSSEVKKRVRESLRRYRRIEKLSSKG
ncbi:MAG: NADP-dependent malic enzyme [Candidatus Micrarchaeota archaeon]|nr:NADP-dependent malic enzyme [Candidatus Micrarchaeota archaeon]